MSKKTTTVDEDGIVASIATDAIAEQWLNDAMLYGSAILIAEYSHETNEMTIRRPDPLKTLIVEDLEDPMQYPRDSDRIALIMRQIKGRVPDNVAREIEQIVSKVIADVRVCASLEAKNAKTN